MWSADVRSLGFFRIGLAIGMLWLLAHPSEIVFLIDPPFFRFLFLAVSIILSIFFLFGYCTCWSGFFSWLLFISFESHPESYLNIHLAQIQTLLFWSVFLPLGTSYSLDRALDSLESHVPPRVFSFAVTALVMQLIASLFSNVCKPVFLQILPIVLLIPQGLWNTILRLFKFLSREHITLYYDGDCGFCKKSVYLLRMFLLLPDTLVLPAQSDASIYADMEKYNSWVIVDRSGKRHYKWPAFIKIWESVPVLGWIAPILSIPFIFQIGTSVYEKTARNRMRASSVLRFLIFHPLTYEMSAAVHAFCGMLVFVAFLLHIIVLSHIQIGLPQSFRNLVELLHLVPLKSGAF